jgi:hypothetical protein
MIYYYIIAFISYIALSYVLRKFVLKTSTNFKDILISALIGLLIYVIYMEIII